MNGVLISKNNYNTNNAWGFGGSAGTESRYSSGVSIRRGKAYFRHLPSESFSAVYYNDNRVYRDLSGNEATAKEVQSNDKLFIYSSDPDTNVRHIIRHLGETVNTGYEVWRLIGTVDI